MQREMLRIQDEEPWKFSFFSMLWPWLPYSLDHCGSKKAEYVVKLSDGRELETSPNPQEEWDAAMVIAALSASSIALAIHTWWAM